MQEKRKYLTEQLESTKDSPKAQTAILRQVVPRKCTARESPKEIIRNDVSYKIPKDIANKMNEHSINTGRRVSETINAHQPAPYKMRISNDITPAIVKDLKESFSDTSTNPPSADFISALIRACVAAPHLRNHYLGIGQSHSQTCAAAKNP
eukprot:g12991.t1